MDRKRSPIVPVSSGRNIAFVNGPPSLLKTASLFYEYVFSVESLLDDENILEINILNEKGIKFVEVYKGREVLHFNQKKDDWRSIDNLPVEEGTPGKTHYIFPSYFGLAEENSRELLSMAILNEISAGGKIVYHLTTPANAPLGDIAYVKEYQALNSLTLTEPIDEFPGIALSNIPIFDVSKISWKQLYEFRKDPDTLQSMRNVRLFVRSAFTNRSLGNIQDELGALIDKQEKLSKSHGVSLYSGVLQDVITDPVLLSALSSTIAVTLLGNNLELGSAVTTISIGIAKVAISLSKNISEHRDENLNDPVNYLISMKKLSRK